jgi:mannose-1-phosphate guanylyltransferase
LRPRAVIVLAGSLRPGQLTQALGRPALDLPLLQGTVLEHWHAHAAALTNGDDTDALPVRVVIDRATPPPLAKPAPREGVVLCVERDPRPFRGSGGLLRDLTIDYADDDRVLVVNGAQVLFEPLASLHAALAATDAEAALVSHQDGVPSGVTLIRCGCLRELPAEGFIDLKEQALPRLAKRHRVAVVQRRHATGAPLRTTRQYLLALRQFARRQRAPEAGMPAFGLVEPGAQVAPTAFLHDSVALRGSRVEDGAVLVRSIVCGGALVRRGETLIDRVVAAEAGFRQRLASISQRINPVGPRRSKS